MPLPKDPPGKPCPKCGRPRLRVDIGPECPGCGVIYAKAKPRPVHPRGAVQAARAIDSTRHPAARPAAAPARATTTACAQDGMDDAEQLAQACERLGRVAGRLPILVALAWLCWGG